MNAARENILRRVRTALRKHPCGSGLLAAAPAGRDQKVAPATAAGDIWPPLGDLETTFRQEFTALKGEIIEDLSAFLAGFSQISCGSDLLAATGLALSRAEASSHDIAHADLGITGCDYLLARTGSIVLTARSAGGRVRSVLPPVHLVLARRDQIVPDLDAVVGLLRQRYGRNWPSMLTVISGASRTADIEKVLVMGAHGPKRLAVHFLS